MLQRSRLTPCGARGGILHGASASAAISDCSFRIADDPPGASFRLTGGSEPEVLRNNFSAEGVYCSMRIRFTLSSSLSVGTPCV